MFSENGPIEVTVRNLKGITWSEDWSKEKLAYFILMANVDAPKFEHIAPMQWVPFDTNEYSWDHESLSLDEFRSITANWPNSFPVTFEPAACDYVNFVVKTASQSLGAGFSPGKEPHLFSALIALAPNRCRYMEFDYAVARDVFEMDLDDHVRPKLLKMPEVENALKRISARLLVSLISATANGKVVFTCRRGDFEMPIRLWYEV